MPGRNVALGIEAGPSNEVGRAYSLGEPVLASHQTRLGEPVLRGHWASPYSLGEPMLGEPSNKVGRAIKRGWASQY